MLDIEGTPAGAARSAPVMHVITNFAASGGAETMLARLLAGTDTPALVVPLIETSERNRTLASRGDAIYFPLGARKTHDMPGAVFRLAQLMRRHRPQAVLCWMYHAMVVGSLAALMAGRPPVLWNVRQALDDPDSLTQSTRLALRTAGGLSRQPHSIIYNSQRAREQHEARGYAAARGLVIPNGVSLPSEVGGPPGAARVFGIAARFHPQKDHATFFRAASTAASGREDIVFRVAGHGLADGVPEVEALIRDAGLPRDRVTLLGEVRDMDSFYRSIDVLVLSSRTEGFPNVVAEAMSHARPVVTTDVGDAALIVADTGRVVPARAPDDLAAAMAEMASMPPDEIRALGQAARDRVAAHYALPIQLEAYRAALAQAAPLAEAVT